MVSSADALTKQIDGEFHGREQGQSGGRESHPHLSPLPLVCRSHLPGKLWQAGTARAGRGRGDCRASPFAMLRASAHRNDMRVEADDFQLSQSKAFFITSVRLSPVTRSVWTSGWRLISSAKGMGVKHSNAQPPFPGS
jgi:hypothetical protein